MNVDYFAVQQVYTVFISALDVGAVRRAASVSSSRIICVLHNPVPQCLNQVTSIVNRKSSNRKST
jgi:hypothetical protein